MRPQTRDLACGMMFVIVGLAFALGSWFTLPIGRAFSMGPGYFPIVLGSVLTGLGLLVAFGGKATETNFPPVAWKGIGLVLGAVLFFSLTVRGLGLGPALLVATFMSAMATGQMSFRASAVLSIVLTVINVALFVYALRLPYPVIGSWLRA